MKPTIWTDCYDDGWTGFIVPASFAHPAKYSKALIERIFDHMLAKGWIRKGDRVGDCFGGVATGGLIAAYRGLNWLGVELEPRFVEWGRQNINLHKSKLAYLGCPLPKIVQGDSRRFHEIVAESSAVVTSPPYANSIDRPSGIDPAKVKKPGGPNGNTFHDIYGSTPGQIGAMKNGDGVDAVVSSPPYSDISTGAGGLNTKPATKPGQQSGRSAKAASQDTDQKYGQTEGQISRLNGGSVEAVVTSPPYGEALDHGGGPDTKQDLIQGGKSLLAIKNGYGKTAGQITGEGETYWSAMAQVYASCFLAIKPGGHIAVVVKDYVKNKQRVPLCDDTARLLEHCGFVVVERVHAMLVKETRHGDLFLGPGGFTTESKSRKSFFRRLAESKGSPKIDYEQVIFCQKPA